MKIYSWQIPGDIELIGKQLKILRFTPGIGLDVYDPDVVLPVGASWRIAQAGYEAMHKQRKIEVRKLKRKLQRRIDKLKE